MKIIFDDVATLTNTRNEKSVDAEVDNIRDQTSLDAYIANTKIHMRWNGKIYVGKMAGMEFTTPGPKSRSVKEGNY
jgi:hypothetical protein|tara:strand:- start:272 stop:499 length:228 start_codon:yes stop_codon:yes gene_type:complete